MCCYGEAALLAAARGEGRSSPYEHAVRLLPRHCHDRLGSRPTYSDPCSASPGPRDSLQRLTLQTCAAVCLGRGTHPMLPALLLHALGANCPHCQRILPSAPCTLFARCALGGLQYVQRRTPHPN